MELAFAQRERMPDGSVTRAVTLAEAGGEAEGEAEAEAEAEARAAGTSGMGGATAAGVEGGAGAGAGAGRGMLPVVTALRDLLPRGGLARGSVVSVPEFGLLSLALAAGASADGAWCGLAGIPEAGVLAGVGLGMDPERILLVPELGPAWPQVVASLIDGCELVLARPPSRASAQIRQRLEATLRRERGVLLVAGDWPGATVRLRVAAQGWTGLGDGHGRLRACCAEVVADGRGEAARTRTGWLWLPAEDGRVSVAEPADIPADLGGADAAPALRVVAG